MRTEFRLLVAVALMVLVMVGTNFLFPPVEPDPSLSADSVGLAEGLPPAADTGLPGALLPQDEEGPATSAVPDSAAQEVETTPAAPRREVVVESPIYRYVFSNYGAALEALELPQFKSLVSGNGPVQLVPPGTESMVNRLVVGQDTVDLTQFGFEVEPADGLTLAEGDSARTLTFTYGDPASGVGIALDYTFRPDDYVVDVTTRAVGLDRPMLVTTLGHGLAFNDADSAQEARAMAYVGNHLSDGINAEPLRKVDTPTLVEGPFEWVAFKSRYFVQAVLPGVGVPDEEVYLGGILVSPEPGDSRARIAVTHAPSEVTRFQLYMGPQDYGRLQALGADLEEVNPYGWRFFRPVVRPFVGAIVWALTFLHENLHLSYGWVLILFGILLRVLLWPLYMKAMRSQLKNMAVQPLLKEIQTKYKDNPERLQKEMMKLYKEHGFNPLGGCLPMLLPWPVLIALFFVFQNTIELRGVPFLWIPDLSAKDPLYLLPIFLAVSMFLLQWISLRSMPESNPQMRLMMWFMPLFFGFIFLNFPAGLNLYYAAMNIATIPQQVIVARERKKVKPIKTGGSAGGGSSGPEKKKKGAKSSA